MRCAARRRGYGRMAIIGPLPRPTHRGTLRVYPTHYLPTVPTGPHLHALAMPETRYGSFEGRRIPPLDPPGTADDGGARAYRMSFSNFERKNELNYRL